MCILCVVQRWSRRVATMLPWLVVPLIVLWAVSQLLPPGLRFEVTSPRLACVLVLLVTLFWYEVLMPRLSLWRARRSARLRERRRAQALELQKLRRAATRRCRNCHTPYRDQNPGGGRFMCSYCGHVSKRPVLDLPVPPENSNLINELIGKNGWICGGAGQDWPVADGIPQYWINGADHRCMTEKSYSGVAVSASRLLSCFLVSLRWLWRKVFWFGSSRDDGSSDGDPKGLSRKQDGSEGCHESRGEKARRKAEEKRQARLEREMLEEEERKQREEVARLVEERRKLRDEKSEAERVHSRSSPRDRERESRKEAEKRRQERRRDKDKGSSKSNSDAEEFDKRGSRENERKREFDKKSENERRDSLKTATENYRSHSPDTGYAVKAATGKPRYFDRVKGSFLSSSRGLAGASFWGRNSQSAAAPVTKVAKPATGSWDWSGSGNRRDAHPVGQTNFNRAVGSDVKPQPPAPKKAWHLLFTRSSDSSSCKDMNATGYLNQAGQPEAQNSWQTDQRMLPNYSYDGHINIAQSLPFSTYPLANGSFGGNAGSCFSTDNLFKEAGGNTVLEEAELFEDPCFIPDPVSLLGPVSESLDSLPVDLGAGFIANNETEESHTIKNIPASVDVSKPSPIESPMSRLRVSVERLTASDQLPSTPKSGIHVSNLNDLSDVQKQGMWQMWGTPLAQDGLGLVAGPSTWFSPLGQNKSNNEDIMLPFSQNPMLSQISMENHVVHGNRSPQKASFGNYQNGGTLSSRGPGTNGSDSWVQTTLFQRWPIDEENHFPPLNVARNESTHESPNRSAAIIPLESSPVDRWPKTDWGQHGPQDAERLNPPGAHVGGLFSTGPDVQSVWSFNQKEKI